MKKIFALVHARNKEFYRDQSAMIWTLLFPLIVLLGFTYGYSGKQEPLLKITVVPESLLETSIIKELNSTPGLQILGTSDSTSALLKVQRYETDLLMINKNIHGAPIEYYFHPDSDKGKLAEKILLALASKHTNEPLKFEYRPVEGKRIRYSDWVLPGLLAMNIMFGSMFGVGYVIVRYRKNGVLKRLRATPITAFQFLTAQVFSRILLMVVTSFIVILGAVGFIGFKFQGSWLDLSFFLIISSAAMISVGLLVAARISNEEVADGVLNLMTWPMIFLSGIWFSLDGASSWVTFISKLLPLSYIVNGLRAIMIDGVRITELFPTIAILSAVTIIFVGIGSAIFKWR